MSRFVCGHRARRTTGKGRERHAPPRLCSLGWGVALSVLAAVPPSTALELSGRVLDTDGVPRGDATVTVVPLTDPLATDAASLTGASLEVEPLATVATGPDGRWRTTIEPGMVRVRIEAPGSVPVVRDVAPLLDDLHLPEARLPTGRMVEIVVVDGAGEPVPEARIGGDSNLRFGPWIFGWTPVPGSAFSDAQGRARLLVPETARGSSRSGGVLPVRLEVGRPDRGFTAAEIDSASARRTIRLPPTSRRVVSVVDPEARPVAGALLRIGETQVPVGITDADGRAEILVPRDEPAELRAAVATGAAGRTRLGPPAVTERPDPVRIELPRASPISGRVVGSETGEPIADAFVWSPGREHAPARTAEDGLFHLVVPDGSTRLGAAARHHVPLSPRVPIGPVVEVPSTEEIEIALTRASSLGVAVVTGDGEPVPGIRVRAELDQTRSRGPEAWRWRVIGGLEVETDARGRARLSPVGETEAYVLTLSGPGFATRVETVSLPLPRGETERVVRIDAGRTVIGRVADDSDRPIADASIELEPTTGRSSRDVEGLSTVTGGDGRFELAHVGADRWTATVRRPGFARRVVPGVSVESSDPNDPLDLGTLVLGPEAIVEGRVVDPAGEPVEDATVTVGPAGRFERGMFPGAFADTARTGPDGAFRIGELPPGVRVDVTASRLSQKEAIVHGIELPTGEPVILLLEPSASVAGRVVDESGRPVAGATLGHRQTRPDGSGSSASGGELSSEKGDFRIERLPTGRVEVTAIAEGFCEGATGVTLEPGEHREGLEIVLEPGVELEGVLRTADGDPVADAQIHVGGIGSEQQLLFRMSWTDTEGRFRVPNLPPVPVRVSARTPGGEQTEGEIDLERGTRVELVLPTGHAVSGVVVAPDGAPGAGSAVELETHGSRRDGGTQRLHATADRDGRFELPAVPDGLWSLEARHPSLGSGGTEIVVDGGTLEGLRIELASGARLHGRILGAEPAEWADAWVQAHAERGRPLHGMVDWEGRWEVRGAWPGTWHLVAWVGGRRVAGSVELEEGAPEAIHDFELEAGFRLEGWVHRDGVPVVGARVRTGDGLLTGTDSDGRFLFEGLSKGPVRIDVETADGLRAATRLLVERDEHIEVELTAVVVAGRVVDAVSGAGLERAEVRAAPVGDGHLSLRSTTSTDSDGGFRLAKLPAGRIRVEARAPNHAPAEVVVDLVDGTERSDLRLELAPSEGVVLRIAPPAPIMARVFVLDERRRAQELRSVLVEPDGLARVREVPEGRSLLYLAAEGRAGVELTVDAPDPDPIPVVLPPACTVIVEAPHLGGIDGSAPSVRMLDAEGRPFRQRALVDRFPLIGGVVQVDGLSPGPWTVVLTDAEGDEDRRSVEASPGRIVRARFD